MPALEAPSLDEVRAARARVAGLAVRTPLLRLHVDAPGEVFLKLENLQPIGSFKIRGAGNAIGAAPPERLKGGVYTASAGNMAQGVAWCARQRGIPATVIVPDNAPETKLRAIDRLGARTMKVSYDRWWQTLVDRGHPDFAGLFVHPVADRDVMAGNGTIGLEILEDLEGVDAVLVPFGGGGLSSGIAAALRGAGSPARVHACEVETAAPLAAAWQAGQPVPIDHRKSFVDGIGGKSVLAEMWPIARALLAGVVVTSPEAIAGAIRTLVERARVVAEGAGAAPVAAAMAGLVPGRRIVCVVSGGNLDPSKLTAILAGQTP
jgi:threonine dehydratase